MTAYTREQQKENRKLWVEALRSGKYTQGKDALHNDGKYCCLGVLCVVSGAKEVVAEKDGEKIFLYGKHLNDKSLSEEIMDFVGLRSSVGRFGRDHDHRDCLVWLNDSGTTFSEIADIIESEPEWLFHD